MTKHLILLELIVGPGDKTISIGDPLKMYIDNDKL